jgi:hypothetical protein
VPNIFLKTSAESAAQTIKRICPSHLHIIITRTTISKEKIREIPLVLFTRQKKKTKKKKKFFVLLS